MKSFVPGAETVPELRRAFGCFGTGVTVITTQTDHGPLGMTANSFSSISLDPPLVMWSPGKASLRHDAYTTATSFCIHVLAADQLDLALHFATQGHDFDGYGWAAGPNGAPTFQGCVATFHCDTHAVHAAGDHSLILGLVKRVGECAHDGPGLLFNKGQFGQFAPNG